MKLAAFFPLFLNFLPCVPYKVLVFNPAFGASHSNYLGKISDILIDAGHEVVSFDTEKCETRKIWVYLDNAYTNIYGSEKRIGWLEKSVEKQNYKNRARLEMSKDGRRVKIRRNYEENSLDG